MATAYTSPSEFAKAYETLHNTFKTGRTKDLRWRKWQLKQCWWMLTDNEDAIVDALRKDMNRPVYEAVLADVIGVKNEVLYLLENFETWAQGEAPVGAGFVMRTLGGAWLRKEPLGVVLVIGAWNFPVYTVLMPVIGAIAAGNCVMMKPSEQSPATQDLLSSMTAKYLDRSAICTVTGAAQETGHILEHQFNHICYTGGSRVGRIIAAAAAKHLTPTLLELGGQNPTIVTKTANIDLAAKRIASHKLSNAGQICLNVNHIFAEPEIHDELAERIKHYFSLWFKDYNESDSKDPTKYPGISSIISPAHYQRLSNLLKTTKGTVTYTGADRENDKYIHPAIITNIAPGDSLLSEELFGPFVPIMKADIDTAIKTTNTDFPAHPLGLYIFSSSQSEINYILDRTNSGGVTINDAMLHPGVTGAPFGGVGESGYGAYTGKYSFEAFSHTRSVVGLPDWMDSVMSWRWFPAWDPKNRSNFETFPKTKFARDETLEDQRISSGSWLGWLW